MPPARLPSAIFGGFSRRVTVVLARPTARGGTHSITGLDRHGDVKDANKREVDSSGVRAHRTDGTSNAPHNGHPGAAADDDRAPVASSITALVGSAWRR